MKGPCDPALVLGLQEKTALSGFTTLHVAGEIFSREFITTGLHQVAELPYLCYPHHIRTPQGTHLKNGLRLLYPCRVPKGR